MKETIKTYSISSWSKTYPAHEIKPGDTINGIAVYDLARPDFGGAYYIPMVDGSKVTVKTLETLVTVD